MDHYRPSSQKQAPVPPMRVSSLSSSETRTLSSAGRSSDASSMRSGKSGMSFESGQRTSNDSTKPRLSKEQQKFLEHKFAQHQKPNTQTKKGFANDLNVPLEKINNWFQNRRAKSKQEAKKKHEAYQHFAPHHPFANGRHPGEQCFIDHSFYHNAQPHHPYASTYMPVLPGNSCEPHVNTTNAHFGVPLETADASQARQLSDQQMVMLMSEDPNPRGFDLFFGLDDSNDPSAVDMYARQFPGPESGPGLMDTIPEYEVPEQTLNGQQASHGNGEVSFGFPYSGVNGSIEMAPSADFFHPNEAQNDRYPLRTWGQSAGRALDGDVRYLGIDTTLASSDSQLHYRSFDDPSLPIGVTPSSLHQQLGPQPVPSMSMESLDLQSPDHGESAVYMDDSSSTIASPNSAVETTGRRDSTVSRLVESIDNVEVQPHLEKKASQQSIGHLSLAARRQRRPPPLGALGARSTSFNSTNPVSPKSVQPSSSDRELRRVRSSIGVMNGRVQKSSHSVSSQRSPHSLTFSDAAASSKIAKSLSSRSMTSLSVDTLSRTNSLVPITPISPPDEDVDVNETVQASKGDHDMLDSAFAVDDVWANMPNTSDTSSASIWSSQVPLSATTDYFENYASPPETPQQSQQSMGVALQAQPDYYWLSSSQMSYAPMMQQSSNMSQYAPMMPPAMMGYHPNLLRHPYQSQRPAGISGHNRQASEPTGVKTAGLGVHTTVNGIDQQMQMDNMDVSQVQQLNAMPEQGGQQDQPRSQQHSPQSPSHQRSHTQPQAQFTPPAGLASPDQSNSQQQTQQQQQQQRKFSQSSGQHVFQLSDSDPASGDGEQYSQSSGLSVITPARSSQPGSQGLMIQQFSPRDPVDPSRMPPKQKLAETPKHFLFQTCGPESFSSP